ncbi:regulatory protein RecX [Acidobacterium capsulatum ATCC 51196]|uniref:Regulatory protein RecX n=2 Tax=Acidobacteriaceae TaxID=204434 RepID=C1F7Q4_ACIC5|nr:regulatory protein RecX [Acidobacterium capsulatum ATCC 51196]
MPGIYSKSENALESGIMAFSRPSRNKEPLDENALYDYALQSLGRRMRTVAELRRLMRNRVEAGEAGEAKMQAVIARLKEYRYLDDSAYAADYARLRQENARLGKRRVRQDLQVKGVNAEIITQTLDAAYENVDEEALARRHLERKGIRQPTNDKESARVMRMLVRAGFSTGTIYKVLRHWNASEDALAALGEDEAEEPGEF